MFCLDGGHFCLDPTIIEEMFEIFSLATGNQKPFGIFKAKIDDFSLRFPASAEAQLSLQGESATCIALPQRSPREAAGGKGLPSPRTCAFFWEQSF